MSTRDKLIFALTKMGYSEIKTRSSKYQAFKKDGNSLVLLVGKRGALKKTRGPISSAISLTGGPTYRQLIAWADKNMNQV